MASPGTGIDDVLQQAARMAGEYLVAHQDRSVPVTRYLPPHQLRETFDIGLPREGRPLETLLDDMRQVLSLSVRTAHPRFFNQLFGGSDTAAILGEWITALVNTSMYTYEAAPVATLMELELIERMNQLVGFPDGEGVFAPGGSTSNLMGVLAARHRHFPHIKREGMTADDRPVIFLSEEAHYSMLRAASIIGIGVDAAVEVACDPVGRMKPDALDAAIQRSLDDGRQPFLVSATSGTTVAGAFDPLDEIAQVADKHGLWFHVDASLGGSVLFSEARRELMAGVERADSVTWNPHKMMGVPLACSATLMREKGVLLATNGMNADYLFHGQPEGGGSEGLQGPNDPEYDLGDLSLQCGRRVDALKLWFSWQAHGDQGYAQRVDELFDMAQAFQADVESREGFEIIREPQSTNICFRYVPTALRSLTGEELVRAVEAVTIRSRQQMVEDGRFLVNYATVDGAATYRMVMSNPETTREDMSALLDEIVAVSEA